MPRRLTNGNRPGRLNVLLGTVQVMLLRVNSDPREANGVCFLAGLMIRS
jgi:hypothetical protein